MAINRESSLSFFLHRQRSDFRPLPVEQRAAPIVFALAKMFTANTFREFLPMHIVTAMAPFPGTEDGIHH